MPPKRGRSRDHGAGKSDVVSDPRFSSMHHLPVFKKLRSDAAKVKLDRRFAAVLTDERFRAGGGKVDKYGRKTKKKKTSREELSAFYRVDDEEAGGASGEAREVAAGTKDPRFAMGASFATGDEQKRGDSASETEGAEAEAEAPVEDVDARMEYLNALARGEIEATSNSDESESDSDVDSDAVVAGSDDLEHVTGELRVGDDVGEMGALARQGAEREEIPLGAATDRVAVLNMDWRNMRALDIFAVLQSFTRGRVRRVTVYPSDFGLEQMALEDRLGPQGLWNAEEAGVEAANEAEALAKAAGGTSDGEEESGDGDHDGGSDDASGSAPDDGSDASSVVFDGDFERGDVGLVLEAEKTEDGLDREELREYEVRKLRYYFAIAECDTASTAERIYDECNGLEFESSSSRLDIRFVPADQDFESRQVRDHASAVPAEYDPPVYVTNCLQNSNITCSWDADDADRSAKLTSYQAWAEMNADDLAIYLASDESSDEDDGETQEDRRKRMRELLLGSEAADADDDDDDSAASSDEVDAGADLGGMTIFNVVLDAADREKNAPLDGEDDFFVDADTGDKELTFTAGETQSLEARMQQKAAGGAEETLTPFAQYQQKKKEKKRLKRLEAKERRRQAQLESDGTFRVENGVDGVAAAGVGTADSAEGTRVSIADAVGDESDHDYDMHEVQRQERMKDKVLKGARLRKERGRAATKGSQQDFAVDTKDARFARLFAGDAAFGIDPTSKEFKDTEATREIMREQRRRRRKADGGASVQAKGTQLGGPPAASRSESAGAIATATDRRGVDTSARAMAERLRKGAKAKGKKKNRVRKKHVALAE